MAKRYLLSFDECTLVGLLNAYVTWLQVNLSFSFLSNPVTKFISPQAEHKTFDKLNNMVVKRRSRLFSFDNSKSSIAII